MKYIYILSIIALQSCSFSKKQSDFKSPDFHEWKKNCLEIFDNSFKMEDKYKGGMIYSYVRKEIENIDVKAQVVSFNELPIKARKESNEFLYIYHYIEGEVNYVVESYIFKNQNRCTGFILDKSLKKKRKVSNCGLFSDKKFNLTSSFLNNGLVIISRFDSTLNLIETKMFYGVAYDDLDLLLELYPN